MLLSRFDPFQELDRLFAPGSGVRGMPMDLYRRGDEYVVEFDVPGLDRDSIEVTVERHVLRVSAQRPTAFAEDDQVLVAERPRGEFRREIFLGEGIDGHRIAADYHDGVLVIRVPLAETAKPQRITVGAGNGQRELSAQAV